MSFNFYAKLQGMWNVEYNDDAVAALREVLAGTNDAQKKLIFDELVALQNVPNKPAPIHIQRALNKASDRPGFAHAGKPKPPEIGHKQQAFKPPPFSDVRQTVNMFLEIIKLTDPQEKQQKMATFVDFVHPRFFGEKCKKPDAAMYQYHFWLTFLLQRADQFWGKEFEEEAKWHLERMPSFFKTNSRRQKH